MSSKYYKQKSLAGIDVANITIAELKALVGQLLAQKIHGICFSPYIEGQGPGTPIGAAQIRERLQIIQPHVNWVRTFSCSEGNELIPQIAKELGLKTLVGVWLDGDRETNEKELQNGIQVAQAGHADLLAVGNEVMLRGEMPDEELIAYMNRAKTSAPNVQVGYVDAYFLFEDYPRVAEACDVIFANCYPYWEGYPAEHSLVYMKEMYRRAIHVAQGKKVIISETGWPNVGTPERAAVPSFLNAIRYFINAYQWAEEENIDIFYFSSFDEVWKIAHEGDVGAYWGLWDKDGNMKYV
ncbi:glycosyl hydrolase family 17 protein [Candidatus Leptofilum sp.]|uniref:glycoside hydrolase family 17 protein n=1 Tax=Candidatus Leptofilum sp. TaxID=3241576 RepID=UPI003B5AB3CF